jgi:glycerophosphoryl diester phosphodiesterase
MICRRTVTVLNVVGIGLVTAAGCGAPALHAFLEAQERPLIIAHRGGGGLAPEATVATMLATHAANPTAVLEFDVHVSRDGELVVIHDGTVDRTTDGTGRVADLTLSELRALDAGFCATPNVGNGTHGRRDCRTADPSLFPFRGTGYQIPTLDEVLAAIPAEAFISVEVKERGIERRVADVLRSTGRLARMAVGAEFDDMAVRVRDALPEVAGYLPTSAATCFALAAKAGWGDYAACPFYEIFAAPRSQSGLSLDTRGIIDAAHAQGMAVVYWTINDPAAMEEVFRLGADGIYTDYPALARTTLEQLRVTGAIAGADQ